MKYDCNILANNNTDFVIADNIKSGSVPLLISGANSSVHNMNFDIYEYCQKDSLFKVKFKKLREKLKTESSLKGKFELIQAFIENAMPLCDSGKFDERTGCVFDGEPFSYMVAHQMCMCSERATLAQYLCQDCGIKSYLINSYVNIKNGEQGPHSYVMFEDNNQMFVYDPANPINGGAPRIMSANMDKTIFADFIQAINRNADCNDNTQKNRVGFVCEHEDGKKFLYLSHCGTKENSIGPKKLKEARLVKALGAKNNVEESIHFKS